MTDTEKVKIPVPEPDEIFNQLVSPSDIVSAKKIQEFTDNALKRIQQLEDEVNRQKSLMDVKEALETNDYETITNVFKDIYGDSMITTGKKVLISMLALEGLRVDDEVHLEETLGEWIKSTYDKGGLKGIYDWATQVDTAMQVIEEYKIHFNSEKAKEEKSRNRNRAWWH